MATELKVISLDTMAREFTLQIKTDYEYTSVPNSVVVRVKSPFPSREGKEGVAVFTTTTNPTAEQIVDGKVFRINSNNLGVTKDTHGFLSFKDGVIEIDCYLGLEKIDLVGNEGDFYATGQNLTSVRDNFDAIIVEGNVYNIDKSKPTNAGTILYFFEEFKISFLKAEKSLRANVKTFNEFRTNYIISKFGQIVSQQHGSPITEKERALVKVLFNKEDAKIRFERKDYSGSSFSLRENIEIGNYLGVLKKGEV